MVQRQEEEEAALALSLSKETSSEGPRIEELEGVAVIRQADSVLQGNFQKQDIKLAHIVKRRSQNMAVPSTADAAEEPPVLSERFATPLPI